MDAIGHGIGVQRLGGLSWTHSTKNARPSRFSGTNRSPAFPWRTRMRAGGELHIAQPQPGEGLCGAHPGESARTGPSSLPRSFLACSTLAVTVHG